MNSILLELQNFSIRDGGTKNPLTAPIDLKIRPQTVYLLKGPNGVGKSSLIRTLACDSNFYGEVLKTGNLEIVTHPQITAPMFAIPLRLSDILSWSDDLSDASTRLLGDLNLERSWDSCSGGERQRVLLAVLFSKSLQRSQVPTLLLLDEPLNHLDDRSQSEVISIIREWILSGSMRAAMIVSHEEILGLECETLTLRPASRLVASK